MRIPIHAPQRTFVIALLMVGAWLAACALAVAYAFAPDLS
jgi:hypothetical protein